jgi:hypothetical protein
VQIPENTFLQPIEIKRREVPAHEREVYVLDDEINDGKPWYYNIRNFEEDKTYSKGADRKDRRALRLLATQYILCGGAYIPLVINCIQSVLQPSSKHSSIL